MSVSECNQIIHVDKEHYNAHAVCMGDTCEWHDRAICSQKNYDYYCSRWARYFCSKECEIRYLQRKLQKETSRPIDEQWPRLISEIQHSLDKLTNFF